MTAANPLNATIPIWVREPWLRTNDSAAASAAWSRVGGMSEEHMLPETSMARMIVVSLAGTLRFSDGLATPTASAARAATNRANGRWRRTRERPGAAWRISERLE
jgi:hypothetical protein